MGKSKKKTKGSKKAIPVSGKGLRVGIDFGTSHTIVALADGGNHPILTLPFDYDDEVLSTDRVQSCIAHYDGHFLYGPAAHACYLDHCEEGAVLIRSIKRLLVDWYEGQEIELGREVISVEELLKNFFFELKLAILRSLDLSPGTEIEAVISVPANSSSAQRYVTLKAFRDAGFKILRILDEPSSSAIQFVHERYKRWDRVQADVVIYDLGGGTFDTTYLAIKNETYDPRLTRGVARLGGDDFDEILLSLVEEESSQSFEGAERVRMLDVVREAKESITPRSKNLHIECDDRLVTIKIKDFENEASNLVDESIALVDDIVERASEGESEADRVVLVGGGSLLPMVAKRLRKRYGRSKVHKGIYPLASVAIGNAIQAESPDLAVRDRLSNHFGVIRVCEDGSEYVDVIFEKGQVLPNQGETIRVERPPYDPRYNIGRFRYLECDSIEQSTGRPTSSPVFWNEVLFPYDSSLPPSSLSSLPVERSDELGHERIYESYELDEFGIMTARIRRSVQDGFSNCYNLFKNQA